jgi:hypothetical protein
VEHQVDLDELAHRLEGVMPEWRMRAHVGPLTWRDERAAWPQPITPDRGSVEVPESLGLRIEYGDDEIEVCVWTGGWADVVWVADGEGDSLCPEFQDVDGAYAAVVQTVEDLLA